jgi:hypothetical protein
MSRRKQTLALSAAALFWFAGIGGGYKVMWDFQRKSGEAATTSSHWPPSATIVRSPDAPTLVVFAHPRCPCTRASVTELREILSSRAGRIARTYVLVLKPHDSPPDWEKTAVWRDAATIPGVTVRADVDGQEAARFGARTSGQALLYDRDGRLSYRGGITALRGEVGDNLGARRVAALLAGDTADRDSSPVFGCPIRTPSDTTAAKTSPAPAGRSSSRPVTKEKG